MNNKAEVPRQAHCAASRARLAWALPAAHASRVSTQAPAGRGAAQGLTLP